MPNPVVNPTVSASRQDYTKRIKDVAGRLKVSIHQNVYEADFEYGKQPMRWEEYTANGGSITHLPGAGGCAMYLPAGNPNALTIRQSRPYHRYQPGKAMFMATAVNFGAPTSGQFQRVGFFDDSNGIFFEQGPPTAGNPAGMFAVIRSDTNYYPNGNASGTTGNPPVIQEVRVPLNLWTDPHNIVGQINWNNIQMLWVEYAWYGAGCLRWGAFLNGEQYILHEIGTGNNASYGGGQVGGSSLTGVAPWARTGNLPVRYEQRDSASISFNLTTTANSTTAIPSSLTGLSINQVVNCANLPSNVTVTITAVDTVAGTITLSAAASNTGTAAATAGYPATTFYHYGVSVIVEGGRDNQRGFTYSYGMSPASPRRYIAPNSTRFPLLSIQARVMGTQEFSTVGGPATSQSDISTITAPTTTTLSVNASNYALPRVNNIYTNGTTLTIVFQKVHNLPTTGGNVVLTSWTVSGGSPAALNGTYQYVYLSPSSISVTMAQSYTVTKPYGSVASSGLAWATNQWAGRSVYYLGTDGQYYVAKIVSNSANQLVFCDPVYPSQNLPMAVAPATPVVFTFSANAGSNQITVNTATGLAVGQSIYSQYFPLSTTITAISGTTITLNNTNTAITTVSNISGTANAFYCIGQINRGQLLPQNLVISSDSLCVVELIASAPGNPVSLIGSNFQPLINFGSANSFATRDVNATALTANSGEVVYAFTAPAGGSGIQQIDLSSFFPLYNTIVGNIPDILTVAVSTRSTTSPGVPIISFSGTGTVGTLTFSAPHSLNVGDQITLSGFSNAALNNTPGSSYVVSGTPTTNQVTFNTVQTYTATVGSATFTSGANVGAHIICQEAMS